MPCSDKVSSSLALHACRASRDAPQAKKFDLSSESCRDRQIAAMAASEQFVDQLGVTAVNASQLEQTLLQKVRRSL